MKSGLLIFVVLFISLTGCKTMMHPEGELVNTSMTQVEQDGKSVWFIYRDSTGKDYEESQVHKIKYSSYRFLRRTKLVLDFYDLKGNLTDTTSGQKYARTVQVVKNGQVVENYFLDNKGHLIKPDYLFYAKSKTNYFKDGTWRVRYFNTDNKPSCDGRAFEIYCRTDTLWQKTGSDSTFLLRNIELSKRDCTKRKIE